MRVGAWVLHTDGSSPCSLRRTDRLGTPGRAPTTGVFLGCVLSECSLSLAGVVVQMKVCMHTLHCGRRRGGLSARR